MKKIEKSKSIALLFIALLPGCSDSGSEHPTAAQAVEEMATPLCGRLKTCFGSSFDEAGCVAAAKAAVPASEANSPDACTNDEIDTCVKDLGTMPCPSGTSSAALLAVSPASCKNC
jgi:hypothetical protein